MSEASGGLHMLDTNVIIDAARGEGVARRRLSAFSRADVAISALTEAELLFGIAKREVGTRYADATVSLMSWLRVLPWDSQAARAYAVLRLGQQALGKPLGRVDLLIAAHALAMDAVLVSRDRAFIQVPSLKLEAWPV